MCTSATTRIEELEVHTSLPPRGVVTSRIESRIEELEVYTSTLSRPSNQRALYVGPKPSKRLSSTTEKEHERAYHRALRVCVWRYINVDGMKIFITKVGTQSPEHAKQRFRIMTEFVYLP